MQTFGPQTDLPTISPREWALSIMQRLKTGEEIPLSELAAFIDSAGKDVKVERKKLVKPLDVDYF